MGPPRTGSLAGACHKVAQQPIRSRNQNKGIASLTELAKDD